MSVASHDFVLDKPHLYDRLENQEIIDQVWYKIFFFKFLNTIFFL